MINISKIFRIYFLHGNFIFQQKKLNFFKNTVVSPRLSQSREFTRAHVSSRELTQTHVSSRKLTRTHYVFFLFFFFFFFFNFFFQKIDFCKSVSIDSFHLLRKTKIRINTYKHYFYLLSSRGSEFILNTVP
jgi:hypothetical protein